MIEVIKEDPEVNTAIGRDQDGEFYWRTLNGDGSWNAYPTRAEAAEIRAKHDAERYKIDMQHIPVEFILLSQSDEPRDRMRWKKIMDENGWSYD